MDPANTQTRKHSGDKPRHSAKKSKQGAAMMAVMLILLLATATAAVTVESTGFEAKASGYNKMATQVKTISEASLVKTMAQMDRVTATSVIRAMQTNFNDKLEAFNNDRPHDEPPLTDRQFGYRIKYTDFPESNKPITKEDVLGPNQAFEIDFSVDIFDAYISTRTKPGYAADGRAGSAQFLQMTYVARGQLKLGDNKRIEHVSCACVEAGPI